MADDPVRGQNEMGRERPHVVRLSAAQKVRGVAPACPEPLGAMFFPRGQKTRIPSDTESDDLKTERRKQLPILKVPPKQPKNAMIQVRVEENIKLNLDKYAEFIGGNQAYVVSEALKLLFKKDEEFKRWLDRQGPDDDRQPTEGGVLAKTPQRL
jgi:hypothetical protein